MTDNTVRGNATSAQEGIAAVEQLMVSERARYSDELERVQPALLFRLYRLLVLVSERRLQDHRMRAYEIEDRNLIPEGYEAYFIDGELNEHGGVGIYTRHFLTWVPLLYQTNPTPTLL